MPYKDPEKRRAATRERVRQHRARKAASEKPTANLQDPPDRDELLKLLGKQAREGHVVAIRTLLEEYRRDSSEVAERELDAVDELAGRRAARVA